jgi:hypothetical protein
MLSGSHRIVLATRDRAKESGMLKHFATPWRKLTRRLGLPIQCADPAA